MNERERLPPRAKRCFVVAFVSHGLGADRRGTCPGSPPAQGILAPFLGNDPDTYALLYSGYFIESNTSINITFSASDNTVVVRSSAETRCRCAAGARSLPLTLLAPAPASPSQAAYSSSCTIQFTKVATSPYDAPSIGELGFAYSHVATEPASQFFATSCSSDCDTEGYAYLQSGGGAFVALMSRYRCPSFLAALTNVDASSGDATYVPVTVMAANANDPFGYSILTSPTTPSYGVSFGSLPLLEMPASDSIVSPSLPGQPACRVAYTTSDFSTRLPLAQTAAVGAATFAGSSGCGPAAAPMLSDACAFYNFVQDASGNIAVVPQGSDDGCLFLMGSWINFNATTGATDYLARAAGVSDEKAPQSHAPSLKDDLTKMLCPCCPPQAFVGGAPDKALVTLDPSVQILTARASPRPLPPEPPCGLGPATSQAAARPS